MPTNIFVINMKKCPFLNTIYNNQYCLIITANRWIIFLFSSCQSFFIHQLLHIINRYNRIKCQSPNFNLFRRKNYFGNNLKKLKLLNQLFSKCQKRTFFFVFVLLRYRINILIFRLCHSLMLRNKTLAQFLKVCTFILIVLSK